VILKWVRIGIAKSPEATSGFGHDVQRSGKVVTAVHVAEAPLLEGIVPKDVGPDVEGSCRTFGGPRHGRAVVAGTQIVRSATLRCTYKTALCAMRPVSSRSEIDKDPPGLSAMIKEHAIRSGNRKRQSACAALGSRASNETLPMPV
jgi:hypothetical protein